MVKSNIFGSYFLKLSIIEKMFLKTLKNSNPFQGHYYVKMAQKYLKFNAAVGVFWRFLIFSSFGVNNFKIWGFLRFLRLIFYKNRPWTRKNMKKLFKLVIFQLSDVSSIAWNHLEIGFVISAIFRNFWGFPHFSPLWWHCVL